MNTAQLDSSCPRHSEKTGSRLPRIFAAGAALSLACAALAGAAAPAMAAPPSPHGATVQTHDRGHDDRAAHRGHGGWDDDDGDDCDGLIVLICHG